MAGCKRCALKRKKGKRREKAGEKEEKMGIKAVFFISPRACFFFHMRSGQFFEYIKINVSRLSRSYPLLFAIKILMEG